MCVSVCVCQCVLVGRAGRFYTSLLVGVVLAGLVQHCGSILDKRAFLFENSNLFEESYMRALVNLHAWMHVRAIDSSFA